MIPLKSVEPTAVSTHLPQATRVAHPVDPVRQDAAYFLAQAEGARRVLLVGGVASGLAAELLRYPLERLVIVQPDAEAFARVRPHLPPETRAALADPRLELRFEDGRRYANTLTGTEAFDLVLVLAGDPSTAHNNRYYTADFYAAVRRGMTPGGVLCTTVGGASNYLGREVRGYGASVLRTLGDAFAHLAHLGHALLAFRGRLPGNLPRALGPQGTQTLHLCDQGAPPRVGVEHRVDLTGWHSDLGKLGLDVIGLLTNQANVQHRRVRLARTNRGRKVAGFTF